MTSFHLAHRLSGLLLLSSLAACSPGFPEYNEIAGLRVLALRASHPDLRVGDEVALDALVFVESGALDGVEYAWSWCPLRLSAAQGGDCVADERTFETALRLPERSLDFDLGSDAQAKLTLPGVAALYAAACANDASARDGVERAFVFACDRGFPISVRADISFAGQTIRSQKELRLIYDEDVALNQNPVLGDVGFRESDGQPGDFTPWQDEDTPVFKLGTTYTVQSAVDEAVAEPFLPAPIAASQEPSERRENLFISWFVTTGETDAMRTTYIEGSVSIDTLRTNDWKLPKAKDEVEREARLFLVLRDERGGVDWLERRLELAP